MEKTKIEWCDHTLNLWHGCAKVAQGCKFCYAERMSNRWGGDYWGKGKKRKAVSSWAEKLNTYQRGAAREDTLHTVFVGSMMDIFEENHVVAEGPLGYGTEELRRNLFGEIYKYPNLIFLLLTKRPENISQMIPSKWFADPPKNVWFGASIATVEDSLVIPNQLWSYTPFDSKRFLSVEPLIENVSLRAVVAKEIANSDLVSVYHKIIHWIIVGGESGDKARPMNPGWIGQIIDDCHSWDIPVFVKQMGTRWAKQTGSKAYKGNDMEEWIERYRVREFPVWLME